MSWYKQDYCNNTKFITKNIIKIHKTVNADHKELTSVKNLNKYFKMFLVL